MATQLYADTITLAPYTDRLVQRLPPLPRQSDPIVLQDAPPMSIAVPRDVYPYAIITPPRAASSIMPAILALKLGG